MINVNSVYKAVLSIMNREQRGLLTPEQFNRIAKQVQLDLLESTFYEYNKAVYGRKAGTISMEYGNIPKLIKEKIDILADRAIVTPVLNQIGLTVDLSSGLLNGEEVYRIMHVRKSSDFAEIEEVSKRDISMIMRSPLTAPDVSNPIYVIDGGLLRIRPNNVSIGNIQIDFIKKPKDPFWGYTEDPVYGSYEYDTNSSEDFSLHPSEEVPLITSILAYAGVTIKDLTIAQAAAAEISSKQSKENI